MGTLMALTSFAFTRFALTSLAVTCLADIAFLAVTTRIAGTILLAGTELPVVGFVVVDLVAELVPISDFFWIAMICPSILNLNCLAMYWL